jgi:hypothetical protein
MNRIKANYLKASIISLFIGFCIYILFRNIENLLFFTKLNLGHFNNNYFKLTPSIFSNIIKYNIPDMLWFLSGILFVRYIWFDKNYEQKIYIFIFCGIAFFTEISQLKDNIPGTFDPLDLIFMGLGAFLEGFINRYSRIRSII